MNLKTTKTDCCCVSLTGGTARVNSDKRHGSKSGACKMKSPQETTSLSQIATVLTTIYKIIATRDVLKFRRATLDPPWQFPTKFFFDSCRL